MSRRAAAAAIPVLTWLGLASAPVGAQDLSCGRLSPEESIARADVVVVGTVTATRSVARVATVTVDDVWKGEVEKVIEVHGGPDDNSPAVVHEHAYFPGRYLFFLTKHVGRYVDEPCSSTTTWDEGLAFFRPATAHAVGAPPGTVPPNTGDDDHVSAGAFFVCGLVLFVVFKLLSWPGREPNDYTEAFDSVARVVCWLAVGVVVVSGAVWVYMLVT